MIPTLATPPSENRRSGGYIYNARIAAILEPRGLLRHEYVPPERIAGWAADTAEPIVLDSLYLHRADVLAAVRARAAVSQRRWTLLAHLLPSQETEREQERRREQRALPLFDAAIAPSRHMCEILSRRGLSPHALSVCAPGTDLPAEPAAPNCLEPPVVLTVANWIPRKNLEAVLEALESCADLEWWWHIVGFADRRSPYVRRLRRLLGSSPVRERITCHGPLELEALSALWRRASLFALATRFESYGMVLAEALSYGVPVIAPRIGAVPEIIESGRTGLLYPADQPGRLAELLRELLSDPGLRRRVAGAARQAAAALPNWEQTAGCFAAACGA